MRASVDGFNRTFGLRFRRRTRIMLVCFEVVEDRTVGPRIAMALGGEPFERTAHRVELDRLPLAPSRAGERQRLHIGARSAPVLPQGEQLADLVDPEPEIARAADELQCVDIALGIIAVAGIASRRRRDEPNLFIMSDHPLADP